jgi:hypothetical protein
MCENELVLVGIGWYWFAWIGVGYYNPYQPIPTHTTFTNTCVKMGCYRLLSFVIGWYWIAWVGVGYSKPYQPIPTHTTIINPYQPHTNQYQPSGYLSLVSMVCV